MKLANLEGRAVLVSDQGAIDVSSASDGAFGPGLRAVFDDWDAFRSWAEAADLSGTAVSPIAEAALGPPSPEPRQVFAIGLNYKAHAEESGVEPPAVPATFTKFPACLADPFAEVELSGPSVDWEVELVVVIGAAADRVPESEGWAHVAGVTVGQDLSDRTVQFAAGNQFSLGKSFRGFAPTGPWLVTTDELPDPDDLALGCSVDGRTVQDARTGDLIFSVPRLVAELSAVVALLPGDLIFTGTPSGVGMAAQPPRFLQAGETLESWIEGIGTIRNRFRAPSEDDGAR